MRACISGTAVQLRRRGTAGLLPRPTAAAAVEDSCPEESPGSKGPGAVKSASGAPGCTAAAAAGCAAPAPVAAGAPTPAACAAAGPAPGCDLQGELCADRRRRAVKSRCSTPPAEALAKPGMPEAPTVLTEALLAGTSLMDTRALQGQLVPPLGRGVWRGVLAAAAAAAEPKAPPGSCRASTEVAQAVVDVAALLLPRVGAAV